MPKGLSTHRRQGEGICYASRDGKTHMPQFGQGLIILAQTEAARVHFCNYQHFTISTSICGVAAPFPAIGAWRVDEPLTKFFPTSENLDSDWRLRGLKTLKSDLNSFLS